MAVIARWIDQFCDLVFEVSYNSILPDKNAPGQRRSDDERAEVPDVPIEGDFYRSGGGRGAEQLRTCAVGHLVDTILNGHDPQRGDPESSRGVYSPPISCAGVLANYTRETVHESSVVQELANRTGAVSGLVFDGDIGVNSVFQPGLRMNLLKLSRAVHSFAARTFRVEKALRADNTGECDEERLVQLQSAFTCVGFPMVGISRGLRRVALTLRTGRTRIYDIWRLRFSFLDFLITLIEQFGKRADEMCAVLHGGDPAKCSEDAASPACPPPRRNRAPTRRVSVLSKAATRKRRAHEPRGKAPSRAHEPRDKSPSRANEPSPMSPAGSASAWAVDIDMVDAGRDGAGGNSHEPLLANRDKAPEVTMSELFSDSEENLNGAHGPNAAATGSGRPRAKIRLKPSRRYSATGSMLKNARFIAASRKERAALNAALGAASSSAAYSHTGATPEAQMPVAASGVHNEQVDDALDRGGHENARDGIDIVQSDPYTLEVPTSDASVEGSYTPEAYVDAPASEGVARSGEGDATAAGQNTGLDHDTHRNRLHQDRDTTSSDDTTGSMVPTARSDGDDGGTGESPHIEHFEYAQGGTAPLLAFPHAAASRQPHAKGHPPLRGDTLLRTPRAGRPKHSGHARVSSVPTARRGRSRTPQYGPGASSGDTGAESQVRFVGGRALSQTAGDEKRARRRLYSKTPDPRKMTLPQLAAIPPQASAGHPSDTGNGHELINQFSAAGSDSPAMLPPQAPP
jgi:hypothetical protein